jgi:hypothetical protein
LETVPALRGMVLHSISGGDVLDPSLAHASVTLKPSKRTPLGSFPQQTNPSTFVGGASCGGGWVSRMCTHTKSVNLAHETAANDLATSCQILRFCVPVLDARPPPLTFEPEKVEGWSNVKADG